MKLNKILLVAPLVLVALTSCDLGDGRKEDERKTEQVGDKLANNQPTPTDIDYSLERYNLIRRAYWVNGEKAKARAVARPAEVPLGYCVLFSATGQVIAQFNVDGKVTSLNSYLTADYYNYYYGNGGVGEIPLPDIDGSYGSNDVGIFFFTPQWQYIEWDGNYLYSDTPFVIQDTILGVY